MIRKYPIDIQNIEEDKYYILDIWNQEDVDDHRLYTVQLNTEDGVVWSFINLIPEVGEPRHITIDTSSDITNRTYQLYIPYAATNTVENRSRIKNLHPRPSRSMGGKKRKRITKSKNKTRKNKTRKNKTRKKKGGKNDIEYHKKYKISNPTNDDYNKIFGEENGTIYFNNQQRYKYSLYKIPLDEKMVDRLRCADDTITGSKLYTYAYINHIDCPKWKEGFGIECEMNHVVGNKYIKLLNKSNPFSKTFDQDVEKCIKRQQLKQSVSPTSVAGEERGFSETKDGAMGGKRRSKKKKSKTNKKAPKKK